MAEATVIREFLVALGFKLDESAQKKFVRGISESTHAVVRLGTVVEGVALAVAVGVARFAANLEALYFASQRTGSSADQLTAYSLAMQNFGASAEDAMGSVENLATFFRKNPGGQNFLAGWLKQIGIDANNLHGEVEWVKALGKMFAYQRAHGQTAIAELIAGQVGISERAMLAMSAPGFDENLDKQIKFVKGMQAATEASHRFEMQWRQMKLQLELTSLPLVNSVLFGEQGMLVKFSKFLKDHGPQIVKDIRWVVDETVHGLGSLLDWFDSHGNEIQRRIEETFGEFKKVYDTIHPALTWLYDQFVALDKATDGWSTKLLVAVGALKAIGALGLATGAGSIALALAKFAIPAGAAAGGAAAEGVVAGGVVAAASSYIPLVKAIMVGLGIGWLINEVAPNGPQATVGEWLSDTLHDAVDHANGAYKSAVDQQNNYDEHWGNTHGTHADALKPQPGDAKFETNLQITLHSNLSDPGALAKLIADEQRRINSDIIREFSAAPR